MPPPPESLPAGAGPPPSVPRPPDRYCPPYPPGFAPPPDAPTAEQCAQIREKRAAEAKAAREKERREYVRPDFIPFAERTQHPLAAQRSTFGWINRLEPTKNGVCRFTEKPKGSVPLSYMRSASSGNMDLWEEWDTLFHDHAIGFVEASFGKSSPVIAVRQGLPDLWIEPAEDDVTLFIGPEEFVCRRRSDRS